MHSPSKLGFSYTKAWVRGGEEGVKDEQTQAVDVCQVCAPMFVFGSFLFVERHLSYRNLEVRFNFFKILPIYLRPHRHFESTSVYVEKTD